MNTKRISISAQTYEKLQNLAALLGVSAQSVIDNALDVYMRQQLLELTNHAYERLRGDAAAWEEVEQERRAWDVTLSDGL